MRVLHVVGNLDADAGGSTSAAFHTCGYLRQRDVDAVLVGTWAAPGAADYISEQWPDLPVRGFTRAVPHHYWHSPALRRWLITNVTDFDLVVVNGLFKFPFVDAARAARHRGVPYVVQPHGSLDPYDLAKHGLFKRVYGPLVVRPILNYSAGVIVTSERERRQLVTYGAPAAVHVVPLPVAAPATSGNGRRFRRSLGIADRAPVVLFLSRIDPKKGLERLLEATRILAMTYPDIRVIVAGGVEDASYGRTLKHLAQRLGVSDRVAWTGLLLGDEKVDALAAADVFALPSDYENFGIVVVEALLAECPVVISDGVYIAEDLEAAGGAYVCGRDVSSLVASIDRVLGDSRGAHRTAVHGRDVARSAFSPASATASAVSVYDAAISAYAHSTTDS